MDPASIALTLSKIIGLGLAVHKAYESDGFDEADISAIKSFLETGTSRSSAQSKSPPGAILLAITTQAFGAALARHWGGSEIMVPGKTGLPDFIAKHLKPDAYGRRKEIEYRTKHAAVRLLEPGDLPVGVSELENLGVLTGDPVSSPYYQALWAAFSNPTLDDDGESSPLDLAPGTAREFERHFRFAFYDLMASSLGQEVRNWRLSIANEIGPTMRHILAEDLASWGTRHVFGNRRTPPHGGALPFMSLDAMYVEPLGLIDHPKAHTKNHANEPQPIQAMIRNVLESERLVVVQADFGHGKSLSARRLARDLAREWISSPTPGTEVPYPIFVKCVRDISGSSYKHDDVLRRALYSAAAEELGPRYAKDDLAFTPPSRNQNTVVILDGLDEIAFTQNQLREFFTTLDEVLTPRHRAVLFTRPGALHRDCLPKGTPVIDLQRFESDRIEEWLVRWGAIPNQRAISIDDITALNALELAKVPILLLMIALVGREAPGGHKPLNRADLYSRFFTHLARGKFEGDSDEHKGIKDASIMLRDAIREQYNITEPVEAMLWLLSRIGWEAHVRAHGEHFTDLQKHHVDAIIRDELRLPPEIAPKVTIGLLLALQYNPSGDSASILFGHQSFREFSVARYWLYQLCRFKNDSTKISIRSELSRSRLREPDDQCFTFLKDLVSYITPEQGQAVRRWAETEVNDERLSAPTLWEDTRYILRENCLALGSLFGKLEIETQHTIRSIWVGFALKGGSLSLYAPNLEAPQSNLSHMRLDNTHLTEANLRSSNARHLHLLGSNLRNANFENADLEHADLSGCLLVGANFQAADLMFANMTFASLQGSTFRGALIQHARFISARLKYAHFQDAHLEFASFTSADLEGANFQAASLEGANFRDANLQGANFQGSTLRGAHLRGANLQGANLDGVIWGSEIPLLANRSEWIQQSRTVYDSETKWPDGFDPTTVMLTKNE